MQGVELAWDALGWEMAQDPGELPRSGFGPLGAQSSLWPGQDSLHFKQGTEDFMLICEH